MIILKLIEWLGQERKPDIHSLLDADILFLSITGLIVLGVWILDMLI